MSCALISDEHLPPARHIGIPKQERQLERKNISTSMNHQPSKSFQADSFPDHNVLSKLHFIASGLGYSASSFSFLFLAKEKFIPSGL